MTTLKMRKNDLIYDISSLIVFSAIIIILISPAKYSSATLAGAKLFAISVLPTLLPFFFLTKVLMELGTAEKLSKFLAKPCKKLFNISSTGAFIFLSGVLCGYPTGAKLTADYYEEGIITRGEAHRITALCSTSGPMFIIGTVGAGFMLNAKIGAVVFFAHIIGAVLNGILFRRSYLEAAPISHNKPRKRSSNIIAVSAQNALSSILIVGVYIILFFLFIEIFLSVFHIQNPILLSIFSGIIEMTRGTLEISKNISSTYLATLLITFIISFGGLCVHLQSLIFLKSSKISYRFFFLQKLTHACFATLVAALLALLL